MRKSDIIHMPRLFAAVYLDWCIIPNARTHAQTQYTHTHTHTHTHNSLQAHASLQRNTAAICIRPT